MSTAFTDETRECEGTGVATWCLWLKAWPCQAQSIERATQKLLTSELLKQQVLFSAQTPSTNVFFCVSNLFTSHWPLRVDGAHVSNNLGISLQHILAQAKSSQHLWLKENNWLFNWPKHLHFHQELTSLFAMYAKNPLIRVVVASVVHRTKIQWTFKAFQLCYAHFRSFSHF